MGTGSVQFRHALGGDCSGLTSFEPTRTFACLGLWCTVSSSIARFSSRESSGVAYPPGSVFSRLSASVGICCEHSFQAT